MTHVPCPECDTGWLMPEPGHGHMRPCPVCHGSGYLSVHQNESEKAEAAPPARDTGYHPAEQARAAAANRS